jgi:signal transduction histidine kinase/CheY-like chemotaxis protein
MAIATSVSLLGLEFMRDLGLAPAPFLTASRFTVWAALSSVLALSAVFLQIFVGTVNAARREAAEKSARLEEEMRRRVQAEASLHQAQKLEALGRLTGGIAHDFNNILTVLLADSDGLARHAATGRPLTDVELEQIGEIRSSTERASALTRQLLAFSSQQTGVPEVVDPDEAIVRFEPMLRRLVREDIDLHIEPGAGGATTCIDPAQFEQVLMNLVLNAVDAMPAGGELTIRTEGGGGLAEERTGDRPRIGVVLVVSDTGKGIDARDVDRVFDPFFTTKGPGRGTGLGLSSVHGIVTGAGGRIGVESQPGRGTTFRVHLPEASAAAAATGSRERTERPAEPARGTILLCEDEAPVRRVTRRALAAAGFRVHEADCAETALAWLRTNDEPVDLLISDLIMPGLNGHELATRVVTERPGVRVLLVSGYTSNVLVASDVGPEFELLEKPFTPEGLLRRVEALLGSR